jgi:hypothetical protein
MGPQEQVLEGLVVEVVVVPQVVVEVALQVCIKCLREREGYTQYIYFVSCVGCMRLNIVVFVEKDAGRSGHVEIVVH